MIAFASRASLASSASTYHLDMAGGSFLDGAMRGPRLARALASVLILPLVVACADAPNGSADGSNPVDQVELGGPISLTLWHAQTRQNAAALEALASDFNRTNPHRITVRLEHQGTYTQLYEKNLGAIQSGNVPDIAVAFESFVADYMKADVVVDLDPYAASKRYGLSRESRDDIFGAYLETNRFAQFGNKLLSFAPAKSLLVMYQNDDVLKELGLSSPRTWADFERVARAATKVGPGGTVVRYGWAVIPNASTFNGWVLSRGGHLLRDDNGTVQWDGAEGLESLRLVQRCMAEQWCYQPKGFDYQSDFGSGRVVFVMESSAGRSSFKGAMPAPFGWSVVSIPQADPAKARTVAYGANLAVFRTTPEKQLAAWLFVKWLAEAPQTARWSIASGELPVRRSAANDATVRRSWSSDDPQGKQAFDLAGTGVPEPNVRGQQDVRSAVEDAITKVLTQRATPEDALKEAGARSNQILKDSQ